MMEFHRIRRAPLGHRAQRGGITKHLSQRDVSANNLAAVLLFHALHHAASGGEIARMMLSLKSILAGHINLPTIIFDEVDTGVSGEIADKMGDMMHDVSESMQVVVITHLPQVAAKGDAHFKVYKTDADTRTVTHVRQLTVDDRIRELAAMISGSEVSEAALSAARALLKR